MLLSRGAKIKVWKPNVDRYLFNIGTDERLDLLYNTVGSEAHYDEKARIFDYSGFSPIHLHAKSDTNTLEIMLSNKYTGDYAFDDDALNSKWRPPNDA